MLVLITILVLLVVAAVVYLSVQIANLNERYDELSPWVDDEGVSGLLRKFA